jgi:site-specific recombinase
LIDFNLSLSLLTDIEENPPFFVGTVIDISQPLFEFASDLNVLFAEKLGISQEQLSVQAVEEYIRRVANKAGAEVVCLVKDQVKNDRNLVNTLKEGRIVLLK